MSQEFLIQAKRGAHIAKTIKQDLPHPKRKDKHIMGLEWMNEN